VSDADSARRLAARGSEATAVTGGPRVELFLRSLAPSTGREQQDRIVERLRTLERENRIGGVDVWLCGDCVCPLLATAGTDPGRRLLDRYERFREWASGSDYDLVGFRRREVESVLTGTTVTGIVFPRMTLAEFRGGSLDFVAPATDGSERVDIADRIDAY
jgi:hypothetical protein